MNPVEQKRKTRPSVNSMACSLTVNSAANISAVVRETLMGEWGNPSSSSVDRRLPMAALNSFYHRNDIMSRQFTHCSYGVVTIYASTVIRKSFLFLNILIILISDFWRSPDTGGSLSKPNCSEQGAADGWMSLSVCPPRRPSHAKHWDRHYKHPDPLHDTNHWDWK